MGVQARRERQGMTKFTKLSSAATISMVTTLTPTAPKAAAQRAAVRELPLRLATEEALGAYFSSLNGHHPGRLYDLVLREIEEPLFKAVMRYVEGNQTHAAAILGINRGTLRKILKEYGLAG